MRSSDSAAFEGTASTKERAAISRIRGAGNDPRFRCGRSPAPTAVPANTHPVIASTDPVIVTGLNRVQLTMDGHKADLEAVEGAFGRWDYARFIELYADPPRADARYSPPECIVAEKHPIPGSPNGQRSARPMSSGTTAESAWECGGSSSLPLHSARSPTTTSTCRACRQRWQPV